MVIILLTITTPGKSVILTSQQQFSVLVLSGFGPSGAH